MKLLNKIPFASVIFIIAIVVYIPSINYGFFVWDDKELALGYYSFDFKEIFWENNYGLYHPITNLSFFFNNLISKSSWHFHLLNNLIHAFNSVLVFYLASQIFKERFINFFIAIVFALHPLQIEAVVWVSGRKDLVYSFFFLLSLLFFIRNSKNPTRGKKIIYIGSFILSILSKPQGIVLPLVFIIYDYLIIHKYTLLKTILKYKILLFFSFLIFIKNSFSFFEANREFGRGYAFFENLVYSNLNTLLYLKQIIFPIKLSVFYPFPYSSGNLPGIYYLLLLVPVLWTLVIYWLVKNKKNIITFFILFFLLNLIMVLQLIPIGESIINNRYTYLALLGVIISVFYIGLEFYKKYPKAQLPLLIILTGYLIFLFNTSYKQIRLWSSNKDLIVHSIELFPNSDILWNTLSTIHINEGNFKDAEGAIDKAIKLNKNYPQAFYNKAVLYNKLSQEKNAIKALDTAIILFPSYEDALYLRGQLHLKVNLYIGAISDFESISNKGKYPSLFYKLGLSYHNMGMHKPALYFYKIALKVSSPEPSLYYNIAVIYREEKEFIKAMENLNHAIKLDPDFSEALFLRGLVKTNLNLDGCNDFENAYKCGFLLALEYLRQNCY
ncbi:MAG: tetratricopeptide repeat protein [Bacteroidetes bacterium]|nr:tetratricopeptide repeat protein [Bacteroidota bacterium]